VSKQVEEVVEGEIEEDGEKGIEDEEIEKILEEEG